MKHLLNSDHLFHEKKILIIDDDIKTQNLLTKFFTINNFHIKIASDGIDAGIKIVQFKPDIIILDISMSNVDGFEVCNRIKTDANNSHIKILILTGYGTQESIDRAMEAGADAFIAKPIDVIALLQRLEDLLNSNERQANVREERAYL
jgi:DNA-binding response OmpR family regulator